MHQDRWGVPLYAGIADAPSLNRKIASLGSQIWPEGDFDNATDLQMDYVDIQFKIGLLFSQPFFSIGFISFQFKLWNISYYVEI